MRFVTANAYHDINRPGWDADFPPYAKQSANLSHDRVELIFAGALTPPHAGRAVIIDDVPRDHRKPTAGRVATISYGLP